MLHILFVVLKLKKYYRNQKNSFTCTVKVVMSKKWCKIDTLLLHTTNRKYHMAYRFMPFPMTLKVIRLLQDLSDISGGFNWHDASRSPSAIAELLVLNSVSLHCNFYCLQVKWNNWVILSVEIGCSTASNWYVAVICWPVWQATDGWPYCRGRSKVKGCLWLIAWLPCNRSWYF